MQGAWGFCGSKVLHQRSRPQQGEKNEVEEKKSKETQEMEEKLEE